MINHLDGIFHCNQKLSRPLPDTVIGKVHTKEAESSKTRVCFKQTLQNFLFTKTFKALFSFNT